MPSADERDIVATGLNDELKAAVQAWWTTRPCGGRVSSHEVGSVPFFEEVERHRYEQEYHIPDVVRFETWSGKRVLEIGCGLGTDLLQFARARARVTGIDLTPRSVELSRRRFALYGVEGQFCVGDAEKLGFGRNTFDLVYSHGVLHHTPNTQAAVNEIHRVLKPGGTAMVMLYHRHSFNYLVNIQVLRRLAFALLRRGVSVEWLSRVGGIPVNVVREYEAVVRRTPRWTNPQLLSKNTDGAGNPLSKVYSRGEARAMFRRFGRVRTEVYWLVKKNIPFAGRLIPRPVDYVLGRLAGWELYVIAIK